MLKRNSSDSVSALFTQLKNGILAKRKTICVPQTNLNWTLASLLVRENFISGAFKISPKLEFFIVVGGIGKFWERHRLCGPGAARQSSNLCQGSIEDMHY